MSKKTSRGDDDVTTRLRKQRERDAQVAALYELGLIHRPSEKKRAKVPDRDVPGGGAARGAGSLPKKSALPSSPLHPPSNP